MPDDLTDLLGRLMAGPDPVLAPPAEVRARGEQRRLRARGLVAGAAALVVVAAAGTAVALNERGGPDALQIATTPTPTPSPAASPPPDGWSPAVGAELLLQPDDGTAVAGGDWSATSPEDRAAALLVVCPTADVAGVSGSYRSLSGAADGTVTSQVIRFADGGGEAALGALRDEVRRCPSRAEGSGDATATTSFALEPGPGADVVAIRESHRECDTCATVVSYWLAVADLSHLSYVKVPAAEQSRLRGWADAARFRLVCADPTCTRGDDALGAEPGDLGPDDEVRLDGIGPVVVGMTLSAAEAAAGQDLTAFRDELGNSCGHVSPRSRRPDIDLMVVGGRVARVEVHEGSTRTDRGIGIGSTEQQARSAYPGRVVERPHAYTGGHYLRVTSNDGRYVLVLETDGNRVTVIRSGTADAALYTEGCA